MKKKLRGNIMRLKELLCRLGRRQTPTNLNSITPLCSIIMRYSNFVAFPIKLNGVAVNTVSAIWTQDKRYKQVNFETIVYLSALLI